MDIEKYIESELFKKLFVFHPEYSVFGEPNEVICSEIKRLNTQVVISLDRNVLSDILTAAKNGCFDLCKNRKETTAFLFWVMKNNFGISPYDALKEQAFIEQDNVSGNKENHIFNYFFDCVGPEKIVHAFYEENVLFPAKSYSEASEDELLDFLPDNADFLFLFAAILHLVYELRSGKDLDEQFEGMIKWYFREGLISQICLTYCILLFTKDGITRPHNYMNDEKVIHGCKNQAMDIYYFQEIDPRRYPHEKYTFMVATHDAVMKEVFSSAFDFSGINSSEEFVKKLCINASCEKRKKYTDIVLNEINNHKQTIVNEYNAYHTAKQLCDKEEDKLKRLLGYNKF